MLSSNMLLLNLILLIDVTFSTPTNGNAPQTLIINIAQMKSMLKMRVGAATQIYSGDERRCARNKRRRESEEPGSARTFVVSGGMAKPRGVGSAAHKSRKIHRSGKNYQPGGITHESIPAKHRPHHDKGSPYCRWPVEAVFAESMPVKLPIASPESTSFTRRFCWRPSGVSGDATGSFFPKPTGLLFFFGLLAKQIRLCRRLPRPVRFDSQSLRLSDGLRVGLLGFPPG